MSAMERRRILVMAHGMLVVGVTLMAITGSAIAEEKRPQIPEILVQANLSPDYCVARVTLEGGTSLSRKKKLLEFIRDGYERARSSARDYSIVGIDYIYFSYFHMLSNSPCVKLEGNILPVVQFFTECSSDADSRCQRIEVHYSLEKNSSSVLKIDAGVTPVELFESIRGEKDLRECVIKIPAKFPMNVADLIKVREKIEVIVTKYSMPILEMHQINNDIYVLFSRMCDQKKSLFGIMIELYEDEAFDWSNYLQPPDFSPDVSEYRYAETGRR